MKEGNGDAGPIIQEWTTLLHGRPASPVPTNFPRAGQAGRFWSPTWGLAPVPDSGLPTPRPRPIKKLPAVHGRASLFGQCNRGLKSGNTCSLRFCCRFVDVLTEKGAVVYLRWSHSHDPVVRPSPFPSWCSLLESRLTDRGNCYCSLPPPVPSSPVHKTPHARPARARSVPTWD
jgi:hypothetical protein